MMYRLKASITRFVDDRQPGFVECAFEDAEGITHTVIEKIPIVSIENLWSDSEYPRPTEIDCTVVARLVGMNGEPLVRIDTELPWHIESTEGRTIFVVPETLLTEV